MRRRCGARETVVTMLCYGGEEQGLASLQGFLSRAGWGVGAWPRSFACLVLVLGSLLALYLSVSCLSLYGGMYVVCTEYRRRPTRVGWCQWGYTGHSLLSLCTLHRGRTDGRNSGRCFAVGRVSAGQAGAGRARRGERWSRNKVIFIAIYSCGRWRALARSLARSLSLLQHLTCCCGRGVDKNLARGGFGFGLEEGLDTRTHARTHHIRLRRLLVLTRWGGGEPNGAARRVFVCECDVYV